MTKRAKILFIREHAPKVTITWKEYKNNSIMVLFIEDPDIGLTQKYKTTVNDQKMANNDLSMIVASIQGGMNDGE